MRAALAADPVGQAVLIEVEALEGSLPLSAAARRSPTFVHCWHRASRRWPSSIDRSNHRWSWCRSLGRTAILDAAVLVGADAQHLPSMPSEVLFMSMQYARNSAFRQPTAQCSNRPPSSLRCWRLQTRSWRHGARAGATIPVPCLRCSTGCASSHSGCSMTMSRPAVLDSVEVETAVATRPAPRAPQLMPGRISASQAQSLVDCPYQFYARRMLGSERAGRRD